MRAGLAVWPRFLSLARLPGRYVLSPLSLALDAPGLRPALHSLPCELISGAPVFPVSNTPEAAKCPPSRVLRGAPVQDSPDSHAWAAPREGSAARDLGLSGRVF